MEYIPETKIHKLFIIFLKKRSINDWVLLGSFYLYPFVRVVQTGALVLDIVLLIIYSTAFWLCFHRYMDRIEHDYELRSSNIKLLRQVIDLRVEERKWKGAFFHLKDKFAKKS